MSENTPGESPDGLAADHGPGPAAGPGPGWYPEPSGGPSQRYWDGSAWTDRAYDPISAAAAPAVFATVGPEVKVTTSWVWILAVLPVLSLVVNLSIDYEQYLLDSFSQSSVGTIGQLPESLGTQLLLGAVGWGVYLSSVLLAFFDWRVLSRRGVQRPFHWAWTFLGGIVYMIGRTVVLRRRGRSAFAPMWVHIGLFVASIGVSIALVSAALPAALDQATMLFG